MNRSAVYLFALLLGAFVGWLAQQFWFAGLDHQVYSATQDLIRNEQRVKALQESRGQLELVNSNNASIASTEDDSKTRDLNLMADHLLAKRQLSNQDFELMFEVAEYKVSQAEIQGAVLYLYDLRPQVDYLDESRYMELLHDFVLSVEKQLEGRGDSRQLIELYRQLVSLEPEYVPYHLSLTHWLIASEEWDEAEQALELAKHDVRFSEETELLMRTISELREGKTLHVVPLQMQGEHYLLELRVDEVHNLLMMLDTGASMSVLKASVIQEHFPDLLYEAEDLQLKTANGLVVGSKIQVPSISFSDLLLKDVALGVLPLSELSYDGLLGMDILKRFEFQIDQQNQQLVLSPKASL